MEGRRRANNYFLKMKNKFLNWNGEPLWFLFRANIHPHAYIRTIIFHNKLDSTEEIN